MVTSMVQERVKNALNDYFSGEILGESLLLARLSSVVYNCEGVENYRILRPTGDGQCFSAADTGHLVKGIFCRVHGLVRLGGHDRKGGMDQGQKLPSAGRLGSQNQVHKSSFIN